jgi:hypothetical protein
MPGHHRWVTFASVPLTKPSQFPTAADHASGGFNHQERWLEQRDTLLTRRLHVEKAEAHLKGTSQDGNEKRQARGGMAALMHARRCLPVQSFMQRFTNSYKECSKIRTSYHITLDNSVFSNYTLTS